MAMQRRHGCLGSMIWRYAVVRPMPPSWSIWKQASRSISCQDEWPSRWLPGCGNIPALR